MLRLYRNVQMLRLERGIKSIRQLEKMAGITIGTIKDWKYKLPRCEPIIKLSVFFGVSVDFLLGLTDDRHPSGLGLSPNAIKIMNKIEGLNIDDRTTETIIKVIEAIANA